VAVAVVVRQDRGDVVERRQFHLIGGEQESVILGVGVGARDGRPDQFGDLPGRRPTVGLVFACGRHRHAQIETIRHACDDVCDEAQLTALQRSTFVGRQFLNPFAIEP